MLEEPANRRRMRMAAAVVLAITVGACADPATSPPQGLEAARSGQGTKADEGPVVQTVTPSESPRNVTLDVVVGGSGFDQGSTVVLEVSGQGIPAAGIVTNSTTFANPHKLIANITVSAEAEAEAYDVVVTSSGGKRGIGVESFTVLALINLGTSPDGAIMVYGNEINNANHVAGLTGASPFFWSDEQGMESMQPGLWGAVQGLNNLDQAVGYSCFSADPPCSPSVGYAVRWTRSAAGWTATSIAGPGAVATAITDGGVIYGEDPLPVRWIPAGAAFTRVALPLPPGRTTATLRDANNSGQAVGGDLFWSVEAGGAVATLILPTPPAGSDAIAVDLSELSPTGDLFLVGSAIDRSGVRQPVRWRLGRGAGGAWGVVSVAMLGSPIKAFGGAARGVNASGDAVGFLYSKGGIQEPVLWPLTGEPSLLPHPSGGFNHMAIAINDLGWVTGKAMDPKTGIYAALWPRL